MIGSGFKRFGASMHFQCIDRLIHFVIWNGWYQFLRSSLMLLLAERYLTIRRRRCRAKEGGNEATIMTRHFKISFGTSSFQFRSLAEISRWIKTLRKEL